MIEGDLKCLTNIQYWFRCAGRTRTSEGKREDLQRLLIRTEFIDISFENSTNDNPRTTYYLEYESSFIQYPSGILAYLVNYGWKQS